MVGAGVAGLEAARVAATRGHRVTLLERETAPGGQVALTASLPRQGAHAQLVEWRLGELERLGVRVELGVDADVETVVALAAGRRRRRDRLGAGRALPRRTVGGRRCCGSEASSAAGWWSSTRRGIARERASPRRSPARGAT